MILTSMQREKLLSAARTTSIRGVGKDFFKSVFSYVPNTAESAYYGFMEQLRLVRRAEVKQKLLDANKSRRINGQTD